MTSFPGWSLRERNPAANRQPGYLNMPTYSPANSNPANFQVRRAICFRVIGRGPMFTSIYMYTTYMGEVWVGIPGSIPSDIPALYA